MNAEFFLITVLAALAAISIFGFIFDPPSFRNEAVQNTVQVTKQDLPKTTDRLIAN